MLLRLTNNLHPITTGTLFTATLLLSLPVQAQTGKISGSEFNPALSVILDGRYTDYDEGFELPGFQLGGEAGLPDTGFALGHSEITLSANVDDLFYGYTAFAVVEEEGSTEFELEEAYLETLTLGNGFTVKFGKFFSNIGYLNSIHDHAHDFTDVPLVYAAMVGNHLADTGLQLRWVAPTDLFWETGIEVTTGSSFPSGENEDNNKGLGAFSKIGGDLGSSASWQVGTFFYSAEFDERDGGHAHGHGEEEEAHGAEFTDGEVDLYGVDLVYKWAPNGNAKEKYLKIQAEYFVRDDAATSSLEEEAGEISADYEGDLSGFYLQTVYQFIPRWRVGLRYDSIKPDNTFSNVLEAGVDLDEFLEDTELGSDESITQYTAMIDFSHSEFSRIRLQVNQIDHEEFDDTRISLQYLMSLGSHGAHKF